MYCWKSKTLLDRYAAGRLEPVTRRRIEAHLSQCRACSEELARVRKLDTLLDLIPPPEVSSDFAARVVAHTLSASTNSINSRNERKQPRILLGALNLKFLARSAIVGAVIWLAAVNGIKVGRVIASAFTPRPESAQSQMWSGLAAPPVDRGLAALMPGAKGDPRETDSNGGRQ